MESATDEVVPLPDMPPSIPALLSRRAEMQPDDAAFTFIDYEPDPSGIAESLTWVQLHRRVLELAWELGHCAAPGDRALILAPHGLDYVTAFLGALQAGLIAVPFMLPGGDGVDDPVSWVMRDASPSVVLTTSAAVDDVSERVRQQAGMSRPAIIEVDVLGPNPRPVGDESPAGGWPMTAYLQYTSGSTRAPAGVVISHKNLLTNFDQLMSSYFADSGGVPAAEATSVSWLPFYHDMGLVLGISAMLVGRRTVLMSPRAFMQRPARWMQLLAGNPHAFSAAPNFAFDVAARKTSDDDMAGLDLGGVHTILNGSLRVEPTTLRRFTTRFAPFNLRDSVIRPSYGLAEATVYVATSRPGRPPEVIDFDSAELSAGRAKRCPGGRGTPLVSYDLPQSPTVRIVDPQSGVECPAGTVGEIWVHGDNVANGYWRQPRQSDRTFGGRLVGGSVGVPEGPWLRTGDSGFVSAEKLFILGRIKDLLNIDGHMYSPEAIESTIQEITGGRSAAMVVPDAPSAESLVAVAELRLGSDPDVHEIARISTVKRRLVSAISAAHGLAVADLVLVQPGSIPTTTSGKVRRGQCMHLYRENAFTRLDHQP